MSAKVVVKKRKDIVLKRSMNKQILQPRDVGWPRGFSLGRTGITQSKLVDWLTCKRKFLMKINGYSNPNKEQSVGFGNCGHQVLDWIYAEKEMPDKKEVTQLVRRYELEFLKESILTHREKEVHLAKAEATLWGYVNCYSSEFEQGNHYYKPEHEFEVPYGNILLRGKMDIRYQNIVGKYIMDHKFKGRIEEEKIELSLPMDIQSFMYHLADFLETKVWADGFIMNVVRKTSSEPHKRGNETLVQYRDRIYQDTLKKPEHYYKRWESNHSQQDHKEFAECLVSWCQEMQYYIDCMRIPCPSHLCVASWTCDFLSQCGERNFNGLKTNQPIFPELELANACKKNNYQQAQVKQRNKKDVALIKQKLRNRRST